MSQTQYRANLSAKDFTFLADQWGRTIIVKGFDQNFSRQIVSQTDPDKDIGIPQIYYCHNVMPAAQGFQSVGYNEVLIPFPGLVGSFSQILFLTNSDGWAGYMGIVITSSTQCNIYVQGLDQGFWSLIGVQDYPKQQYDVTTANINGQTYIYFPGSNCATYNELSGHMVVVPLTGLVGTDVIGICESFGYMIAWTNIAVFWSSTVDPTDFTPSLITGAGGGGVQEIRGVIYACVRHIFGFIIYSEINAVAAVYSGNARYPFNFREISNGGGTTDVHLIATDPESGNHMAYTTAGFQLLSVTAAANQFPELTNFIGGSRFEDFDETTLVLSSITVTNGSFLKAVASIAQRYLVISYGINSLTHALVYDSSMKRWGKVKINHVRCFEWRHAADVNVIAEQARNSIGFLQADGTVQQLNFEIDYAQSSGVILLGKYQHTRNRLITLDTVSPELVDSTKCTLYDYFTLDGKVFQPPIKLIPIQSANGIAGIPESPNYNTRITAVNHSLCFIGKFSLDSIILSYHMSGRR